MTDWENAFKEALRQEAADRVNPEGPHLEDFIMLEFLEGEQEAEEQEAIRAHLSYCPKCVHRLIELQNMPEPVQKQPADVVPMPKKRVPTWIPVLATAAVFLLGMITLMPSEPVIERPLYFDVETVRSSAGTKVANHFDAVFFKVPIDKDNKDTVFQLELSQDQKVWTIDGLVAQDDSGDPGKRVVQALVARSKLETGVLNLKLYGNRNGELVLVDEFSIKIELE